MESLESLIQQFPWLEAFCDKYVTAGKIEKVLLTLETNIFEWAQSRAKETALVSDVWYLDESGNAMAESWWEDIDDSHGTLVTDFVGSWRAKVSSLDALSADIKFILFEVLFSTEQWEKRFLVIYHLSA